MKRIPLAVLTAGLALVCGAVFLFAASVTRYLLSMDAARIRLLNYQISSRVLEERFVTQEMRLDQELQGHVLESTVLNFDRFLASPGAAEKSGIWMLNGIRLATGKPLLRLEEDQENIRKLQVAFQLERMKRIQEAAAVFAGLESRLTGDDRAFVLLHSGYCQFLLGEEPQARKRLGKVLTDFPGTHFARSAALILDALDAGTPDDSDILQKADEFYRNRRFENARKLYASRGRLPSEQAYRYARTLEETGRIKGAVPLYRRLAESSSSVQTPAVRRLLILGVLFNAGAEVADYARNKSRELKDDSADHVDQARQVTADVRMLKEPAGSKSAATAPPPASSPAPETPAIEIQKKPEETRRPNPRPPVPSAFMSIRLRGGKTVRAAALVVSGDSAVIMPGAAALKLSDIEEITSLAGPLRLNQADVWTRWLRRQGAGFITAEKAFIPQDALREIRAAN